MVGEEEEETQSQILEPTAGPWPSDWPGDGERSTSTAGRFLALIVLN